MWQDTNSRCRRAQILLPASLQFAGGETVSIGCGHDAGVLILFQNCLQPAIKVRMEFVDLLRTQVEIGIVGQVEFTAPDGALRSPGRLLITEQSIGQQ